MSDERAELSGPDVPWFLTGQGYAADDVPAIVRALHEDRVRQDSASIRAWLQINGNRWPRTL